MLVERRGGLVRARDEDGEWQIVYERLPGFDSMLAQMADPRRTPELLALREQMRSWRFYDHFRTDAAAPARMPQIGTHTPVLGHEGTDLAAALQTIREIGDANALDEAVDDAFPGASVAVESHDGRFETTMRQHGLLRPLRAVELSDGRVMVNIRSESKPNRRAYAISPNGATDWSKPEFHDALLEPICMASLIRMPLSDGKSGLLFSNPYNLDVADATRRAPGRGRDRKNLSLQLSRNDGLTWPVRKTLEPGFSGYSDLAVFGGDTILCFYERGSSDGMVKMKYLTLARLDEAWLTAK